MSSKLSSVLEALQDDTVFWGKLFAIRNQFIQNLIRRNQVSPTHPLPLFLPPSLPHSLTHSLTHSSSLSFPPSPFLPPSLPNLPSRRLSTATTFYSQLGGDGEYQHPKKISRSKTKSGRGGVKGGGVEEREKTEETEETEEEGGGEGVEGRVRREDGEKG
eukprot:135245-Hanusia_phi.AAC.1